jgi:voltage-gated potassium channel
VLQDTKTDLIMTLFTISILIILSSTLMFYIEHDAQPTQFENIGHSLWWSVATLTTVGYGDIYPITPLGRILASIIAIIGIGFVAIPTAIISSAFISKIQDGKIKSHKHNCICPNCGHNFKA